MKNLKLVSVRLEPDVLEEIDKYCAKTGWRTRSMLLSAGAAIMAEATKRGMVDHLCRFSPLYGDKCDKFEFEFHRELH